METKQQTPANPMTIAEVLDRASSKDLKYLAAIGITALTGMKGSDSEDFSAGDYYERLNQVVHEVAPRLAPRPAFLPTDEETVETDGQAWRDNLDSFMWNI